MPVVVLALLGILGVIILTFVLSVIVELGKHR